MKGINFAFSVDNKNSATPNGGNTEGADVNNGLKNRNGVDASSGSTKYNEKSTMNYLNDINLLISEHGGKNENIVMRVNKDAVKVRDINEYDVTLQMSESATDLASKATSSILYDNNTKDDSYSFAEPYLDNTTRDDSYEPFQYEDDSFSMESSIPVTGSFQLRALLFKNFITKYRQLFLTLMEIFSPMLFMLLLIIIFRLLGSQSADSSQYSSVDLKFPSPITDMLFDHFAGNVSSDTDGKGGNKFEMFTKGRKKINEQLAFLDGPLVIPTFDQFAQISNISSMILNSSDYNTILESTDLFRLWGNIVNLGTIHITPKANPMTQLFIDYLNQTFPDVSNVIDIKTHTNERIALSYINRHPEERAWALIDIDSGWKDLNIEMVNEIELGSSKNQQKDGVSEVKLGNNLRRRAIEMSFADNFDLLSDTDEKDDLKFTIRMNYTTLPNTAQIVKWFSLGLDRSYQRYYLSGFLTLQRTLNEFAFHVESQKNGNCNSSLPKSERVWSMPMPTESYERNIFYQAAGIVLSLTIATAYLYPTSRLMKLMVEEKESKIKQTMQILGVKQWAYWLSWVITSYVIFTLIAVLVTFLLTSNIFKYSSTSF